MMNERENQNATPRTIYKEYTTTESNYANEFDNQYYYNSEKDNHITETVNNSYQQEINNINYVAYDNSASQADLEPSATTMGYRSGARNRLSENAKSEDDILFISNRYEEEDSQRFKLTTRGKTLIAVYAIAVAVLFAVIILNTTVLRSMNSRVESLQEEIQLMQTQNEQLSQELKFVQSEEEIVRKAQEMGMIK